MTGIVDFHSHILPGIDDGSASVEESIAMLRAAAEQGIRHMVATPHFYPNRDTPRAFLEKRDRAEEILRREMEKYSDLPRISVGAEVYFFPGISRSDQLERLTIDGKKCILLEMPFVLWTDSMYREIGEINAEQGLTPIIAHVDRYISPFRTHSIPQRLAELPALVQANAGFFLNWKTRSMALRMLHTGQIHLLGSDCHNLTSRPPNLGPALRMIRNRLGEQPLEQIQQLGEEIL